jgi:putative glutamine amidotransferase
MKVAIAGLEKNLKHYIAAASAVGLEPVITIQPEQAADCAGLILPGGGDIDPALYGAENNGSTDIDRALDEAQLSMIRRFANVGLPILGICKGHQLLNVYFGGTLIQDLATAQTHRYQDGDRIHECICQENSLLAHFYGTHFVTNSAHHQGLGRVGVGLRVTAYAVDGTAEAIEHDTLPLLGVQFHPERMCFEKARPDTADGAPLFLHLKSLMAQT